MSNFLQVKTPVLLRSKDFKIKPINWMSIAKKQEILDKKGMKMPMEGSMEEMEETIDILIQKMEPFLVQTMEPFLAKSPLQKCEEIRPLQNMTFLYTEAEDYMSLSCDELAGLLLGYSSPGDEKGAGLELFGSGAPQEEIVSMALENDTIGGLLNLVPYDALLLSGGMQEMVGNKEIQDVIQYFVVDDIVGHCMHFCGAKATKYRSIASKYT